MKAGILETVKTVVVALLIAGVFRTVFFQPFWIPSGSMKDTLLIGDFLFVNKMAYGYSRHSCPFSACPFPGRILGGEPELGDVAVFRHPVAGTDFIKRVVGLPGDSIRFEDGIMFINGEEAPQVAAGVFEEPFEPQGKARRLPLCTVDKPEGACEKMRFVETLPNGRAHSVLDARPAPWDEGRGRFPSWSCERSGDGIAFEERVFDVPEGHYFMVGDNRDNSADSRFPTCMGGVEFVPYENLIGRADRVMFSSAGRSLLYVWTWRGDRYFKAIE